MQNIINNRILDFSIKVPDPLTDTKLLDTVIGHPFGHKELSDYDLTSDLKSWFRSFGLEIKLAEAFCCSPGESIPIHSDDIELEGCCKINWFFGLNNVPMIWYKTNPEAVLEKRFNSIGGYFFTCAPEMYEYEVSGLINNPSLVRVDLLHSVTNNTNTPWWCVSLVPRKRGSTRHRIVWDEALEVFKDGLRNNG